ncbi:hypothetical protein [Streptomyces sp. 8N706]|uniref:hypothetical protein n=1 Tax=Streptomyces sp. 8N706 TaxID=3457416 RepID=UPI003FD5A160
MSTTKDGGQVLGSQVAYLEVKSFQQACSVVGFCSRVTTADVHDVEQRPDDAVFDVHEK